MIARTLIATGLLAVPAGAVDMIFADPWEVIHLAREHGGADVGRDAFQDPEIRGELDGRPYSISFYGCSLARDCTSVVFRLQLRREGWKPDKTAISRWNREKLFGRAYIGDDGGAVIDMPVNLVAGVAIPTLRDSFERWSEIVDEFAEHVDF